EALAHFASCTRLLERELGRRPSRELERLRLAIGATSVKPAPTPALEPSREPQLPAVPLVGRVQELTALRELVVSPDGRLHLLLGDPGIGKSRLLDEVVALAKTQQLPVLRGRGVEAEQVRPYGAWLDAFSGAGFHDHPFATTAETD